MNVIYEPKGKAREYSPLALNIYNGCDHNCLYCYVNTSLNFNQFDGVSLKKDIFKKLELDCKNNNIKEQVLLSFTGDPYCSEDVKMQATRECLKILLKYQVPVAILSKGGYRILRDIDLFKQFDLIKIGVTLTFDNDKHSKYYESGASLPKERIETLKLLKDNNIKTFVSLEPVFSSQQTLNLINSSYNYVDLYKIGKLNHYSVRQEVDWKSFLNESVNLCKSLNKDFYIKEDLLFYDKNINIKDINKNKDYWSLKKIDNHLLF